MRAGVEQIAVVAREADKTDLPVVREAFHKSQDRHLLHAANDVFLHVAEKQGLRRRGECRDVVVDPVGITVERVRCVSAERRSPEWTAILVFYLL